MFDYEKTVMQLVQTCAESGVVTAQNTANAGNFEPLYLYYKASTENDNGVLTLIPDSVPLPLAA